MLLHWYDNQETHVKIAVIFISVSHCKMLYKARNIPVENHGKSVPQRAPPPCFPRPLNSARGCSSRALGTSAFYFPTSTLPFYDSDCHVILWRFSFHNCENKKFLLTCNSTSQNHEVFMIFTPPLWTLWRGSGKQL